MAIRSALKVKRFYENITQAQLGEKVGLDQAIICRLENDLFRDTPAVRRWKKKIADFFNVPVESLFQVQKEDKKGG